MSNRYRIFSGTEEEGVTPAGGKIEVSHGCNGVLHADLPTEVWRDEGGKVIYAALYPIEERGPCDGTCTLNNLGGFLYPVETEKLPA